MEKDPVAGGHQKYICADTAVCGVYVKEFHSTLPVAKLNTALILCFFTALSYAGFSVHAISY